MKVVVIILVLLIIYIILNDKKKYNKKQKNDDLRLQRYFYYENCVEFVELVLNWQKNPDYNETTFNNGRIYNVDGYINLQTVTAKIVFLFNLILDISDFSNVYRMTISMEKEINTKFLNDCDIFLNEIIEPRITASYNLDEVLKDEAYFSNYKESIKNILSLYDDLIRVYQSMNTRIKTNIIMGMSINSAIASIESRIQKAMQITDECAKEMIDLQSRIDLHNNEFNYWKSVDSQTYMTNIN